MNFSKKHKKHLSDVSCFFNLHHCCIEVCDAYDSDLGCEMSFLDQWYACPFRSLLPDNVESLHHMVCFYRKKKDKKKRSFYCKKRDKKRES